MKSTARKSALCAALLCSCVGHERSPTLLFGLSDAELNLLGQHLGYRVDALGMGSCSFTHRNHVFYVQAHYHNVVTHRDPNAEPVQLIYDPPGRRAPVEVRIPVAAGITFEGAEQSFRRFLRQCQLPSAPPPST